jgi:hypothetical protein
MYMTLFVKNVKLFGEIFSNIITVRITLLLNKEY